MGKKEIEVREFRRGSSITVPRGLYILIFLLIGFGAIGKFLNGDWIWGVVYGSVFVMGFLGYRWEKNMPIIRFAGREMFIFRHQFKAPIRVNLDFVQNVDEPRPSVIRLFEKNGKEILIQKHWLKWEDRNKLIDLLKSLTGET